MAENEKNSKCLVCGSSNLKWLKDYERYGMFKCRDCSFVFIERIPTAEELDAMYSSYSYNREAVLSPVTVKSYNLLLDEFEKYRKTNKILDMGCGRGWFLLEAKKRGWEVYGTEFSKKAVEICTNNGIVMEKEKFDCDDFDIITLFEVIEHINNPNEILSSIYIMLRKEGLFYCTTPNFNSLLRYYLKADYNIIGYPEHLSYYTKSTLNKVARNNAFKPFKFLSTGISLERIKVSKEKAAKRKEAEFPSENKTEKALPKKTVSIESSDEVLRESIECKWYLGLAKVVINKLLTWTNTGITLKGYYIKK